MQGLVTDLATTELLMNVSDGANTDPATFDSPAAHACDGSLTGATSRFLQTGNTTTVSADTFSTDFFDLLDGAIDSTEDGEATVDEVVTAGILLTGTDEPGGQLYGAAHQQVRRDAQVPHLRG